MRKRWFLVEKWLLAFILLVPQAGLTQPTSEEYNKLLQEIEALKAGQKAISNDVQEIKKFWFFGNSRSCVFFGKQQVMTST